MRYHGIGRRCGRLAMVVCSASLAIVLQPVAANAVATPDVSPVASTASAGGPACSGSYLCLWSKADMESGTRSGLPDNVSPRQNGGCQPLSTSSRSGVNNLDERATLYRSTDCRGGEKLVLDPGAARADFGFNARSVRTELRTCS